MASQITSVSIVRLAVCSGGDQRKHQSSALLAFVRGIHWWPVDTPHKGSSFRVDRLDKPQSPRTWWWRHQMETFSALLAICAENSPSDTELWCFLWSAPELTVEWTMVRLVIWHAIALFMTSLKWYGSILLRYNWSNNSLKLCTCIFIHKLLLLSVPQSYAIDLKKTHVYIRTSKSCSEVYRDRRYNATKQLCGARRDKDACEVGGIISPHSFVIQTEQLFTVLEQWITAVPKVNWALSRSNHTKCYPSPHAGSFNRIFTLCHV